MDVFNSRTFKINIFDWPGCPVVAKPSVFDTSRSASLNFGLELNRSRTLPGVVNRRGLDSYAFNAKILSLNGPATEHQKKPNCEKLCINFHFFKSPYSLKSLFVNSSH